MTRIKKTLVGIGIALTAIVATPSMYGALTPLNSIEDIERAEEAYFAKHGRYLQILPGNKLPHYETGKVSEKFGKNVSSPFGVHIYETPEGEWGYVIYYENDTEYVSKGYGVEAEERTFTRSIPRTATSTP